MEVYLEYIADAKERAGRKKQAQVFGMQSRFSQGSCISNYKRFKYLDLPLIRRTMDRPEI